MEINKSEEIDAMEPVLIDGGSFKDNRGELDYFNSFSFDDIKRFYIIKNKNDFSIRAWQGHKIEKKYFFVTKGSFIICAVKVDNWSNPSPNLNVYSFDVIESEPQILHIPSGYANGFKAMSRESNLIVFSNLRLEESQNDIYRFPQDLWYNWSAR